MTKPLSPKRPYLLKAYFDWLVDNELTPYLVVNAEYFGVKVPTEYVKDGQIVLNLSINAVGNLEITNDFIQFSARFRGQLQNIHIPMGAAIAIYARENGEGVMFEDELQYVESLQDQPMGFENIVDSDTQLKSKETNTTKKRKADTSHLRIIK
ncbi:ClpXP protease specificity-enhancing factor [Conservatibacter flavescens]|uniref:ClpXP protease specificity-enhancing factor n=1 Tax=Conservatibacter flavescens TaxID=28161 RepID=A0A2M8S5I5_9PAST|nr:ClpXP protease specificity-enhancing factor [Conservatibacter flavescens]PJG86422.1 ClpXP protease specificity-enhancing factor [Conservatibacter flavescens]